MSFLFAVNNFNFISSQPHFTNDCLWFYDFPHSRTDGFGVQEWIIGPVCIQSSCRYAQISLKTVKHVERNGQVSTTSIKKTRQWIWSLVAADRRSAGGTTLLMNLCLTGRMWCLTHMRVQSVRMAQKTRLILALTPQTSGVEKARPNRMWLSARTKHSWSGVLARSESLAGHLWRVWEPVMRWRWIYWWVCSRLCRNLQISSRYNHYIRWFETFSCLKSIRPQQHGLMFGLF